MPREKCNGCRPLSIWRQGNSTIAPGDRIINVPGAACHSRSYRELCTVYCGLGSVVKEEREARHLLQGRVLGDDVRGIQS